MTTRTTRLLAVLGGGLVSAGAYFGFYDPVQKTPVFLKPALLIYYGAVLFLGTNIVLFCFNLLKALFSVHGSQDEQEVERVVGPALEGRITDERLIRHTEIPFFAGLGILAAGILIRIFA